MDVATDGSFQVSKLPDEAAKSAEDLGGWLSDALFKPFEKYEVCVDNIALVENSRELLRQVEHLLNISEAVETRITALRFKQSATIPMKADSTVDLIPIIISGTARLGNVELEMGHYVHLTDKAPVKLEFDTERTTGESEFYCLLLLSQKGT